MVWLRQLPGAVDELKKRWSLTVGSPIDTDEVSCAWVAPVRRADGSPAILKLGMPHMEGRDEIHGLVFWDGEPTVRLFEIDEDLNAMLMECCTPGTVLRNLPEPEQDVILATLLRRLWRIPKRPHPFRHLSEMLTHWSEETMAMQDQWTDPGLVRTALRLFDELSRNAPEEALLATDLHAGNVLRAQREPWLIIDPKPFIGDIAYDATQHLFNCRERLAKDPWGLIRRFSDLLDVDYERVRLWMFARAAIECRDDRVGVDVGLTRALAP